MTPCLPALKYENNNNITLASVSFYLHSWAWNSCDFAEIPCQNYYFIITTN